MKSGFRSTQMRVLIVKIGAIGDVVMGLSMLPAIRDIDRSAHITWVVGKGSKPILELVAGVDKIVMVDEARLFRGPPLGRVAELAKAWRRLAGRSFDIVATAHSDWRYRALSALSFAGTRRSFSRRGPCAPIPGRYLAWECVRLISGRDGPDTPRPGLPVISQSLPPPKVERMPGETIVVLAPGGARNILRDDPLRRWPVSSYVELAKLLIGNGCRVVLVGGTADLDMKAPFAGLPVTDLIGGTSLPELTSTLRAADVIVTHDSLALHLGVLLGKPVVALFGPTVPHERCSVTMAPVHVIWGGERLACRPCYNGRDFATCAANRCLMEIPPAEVFAAVRGKIGKQ